MKQRSPSNILESVRRNLRSLLKYVQDDANAMPPLIRRTAEVELVEAIRLADESFVHSLRVRCGSQRRSS